MGLEPTWAEKGSVLSKNRTFSDINDIKADFNAIYQQCDPRAYHTVLGGLDYVIPEVARPVFQQLADRCIEERGGPITILDVGCSYGVNAALLRYGLSLRQLRARYTAPTVQDSSPEQVIELDAHYYAAWPDWDDVRIVGLDISREAIDYAVKTGLLADGAAVDLESEELSDRARKMLSEVDLIISTGCVGYVGHRTFDKILDAARADRTPWVASFVLRMFDYGRIEQSLAQRGLQTEKLEGATFVQRRFRDEIELARTVKTLKTLGVDPMGKETEGLLHAELFVSRPEASVTETALTEIVSLTSGIARARGDRQRCSPAVVDSVVL